MAKKLTRGDGWRVISADNNEDLPEVISKPPEKQKAKLTVEKRKKGKVVTLISGLVLTERDLNELAKSLKIACGTGGTVTNGTIEIQGDNQEKACLWLKANNWGVR